MKVFVNNKLVPAEKATVSVFDHGFLYGDGVFETLRSYSGVIFKLDAHLKRLKRSSTLTRLRIPFSPDELRSIIYNTLCANKLSDAYIRVSVTRGEGPIGLDTSLCHKPNLIVITKQLTPYPESVYKKGVKVIVSGVRRNLKEAVNPEIKSLNFMNNILAKAEAGRNKAFEAIMLNYRGFVTEGTVSNIFMARKGILVTPSVKSGILDGITRRTVLQIAKSKKIKTLQKEIKPGELYDADEVFLTNTTLEIMPVRQVDQIKYKERDVSETLMSAYRNLVKREIKKYKSGSN